MNFNLNGVDFVFAKHQHLLIVQLRQYHARLFFGKQQLTGSSMIMVARLRFESKENTQQN